MLPSPRKSSYHEQNLIARTGVTKVGYLLKRQSLSSHTNRWKSCFIILNDHCLSYCYEKYNFERPEGNVLLTAGTRVYQQVGEDGVIRIETGYEVLFLKGKDECEMKEWKKAIHTNAGKLRSLARGQFKVKSKGRMKEFFFMLHKECITKHPSFSQTDKICKIYQITDSSTFEVNDNRIDFNSGIKGDETLTMVAKNDIEHQHWCYSLGVAIESQRNDAHKTIIPPPILPVHSGSLLSLDTSNMKWSRKYLVLTEDSIFLHGHRRIGFDAPHKYMLTPNVMIFSTTLKEHSFELVFFSESLHLNASSDAEKGEWMFTLQKLIPKSSYDGDDTLQVASLERNVDVCGLEFLSENSPGILLERRGNWAIASVVSETISRIVCPGSVLAAVNDESAVLMGFESVVGELSLWKPPLRLSFWLSPRKMGWLMMMVKESTRHWWELTGQKSNATGIVSWEKVYATVSSGVLTLFTNLKKDGKSKKSMVSLYGSAIGLVVPEFVDGNQNCFRILNGIQSITLQAASYGDMMDWSTAVSHAISMENGGGLLLEKEKAQLKPSPGIEKSPTQMLPVASSVLRGTGDKDGEVKSIVFSKSIKSDQGEGYEAGVKVDNSFSNISPIPIEENLNEGIDFQGFRNSQLPPIMEKDTTLKRLNTSHATEITEAETIFKSLDPVDLSDTMESFARDFFVAKDSPFNGVSRKELPVQTLRKDPQSWGKIIESDDEDEGPWPDIDRASSTTGSAFMSDEEVLDKFSDISTPIHINTDDFTKLIRCTNGMLNNGKRALKISDFDACVNGT